ncbi:MAG: ABC transporter ATP-binding protein [Nitriliruptorales bacterium]
MPRRDAATTPDEVRSPVAQGRSTAAPKIQAERVRKTFSSNRGEVVALDGVDLAVEPGEFVSIVGPSGCGKSTFLYIVGGFVDPTSGTASVDGKLVKGPGPDRGIVFQEFVLFPWKTVLGNVTYGLSETGASRRDRHEKARAYIEMVKLTGFEKHYPKELSGGMKQRVALARTLIMDPDVLLMDEPFGSIDAQTRAVLQTELVQIWERTKKTVLFVTHSVEEALYLSDRIYVFSQRPGHVKEVVDVDLPRPRDSEAILGTETYVTLHRRIWDLLREEQDADGVGR